MNEPTFSRWLTLREDERAVALDALHDRLPPGYSLSTRRLATPSLSLPRYFHHATGVTFSLVFGDSFELGMAEVRAAIEQVFLSQLLEPNREPPQALLTQVDELRARVELIDLPPCLVGEVLTSAQLSTLGVNEALVNVAGLSVAALDTGLGALARVGWRAPSEAEWQYVSHLAAGALDTLPPQHHEVMRNFVGFGNAFELCRDEHDRLIGRRGLPRHLERQHVHHLQQVAVRPWVSLRPSAD